MWHLKTIEEVLAHTGSTREGLPQHEIEGRQQQYGPNSLEEKKKKPAWAIFLAQFKDFMILVLMAAAVISGVIGDVTDTIIIFIIILLNAVIGFIQEYNAEKAMDALKKMSTVQATVLRNGEHMQVPSTELVPGDIVQLEAGNIIPADIRLIESHGLQVSEAALTGESVPVHKTISPLTGEEIPLGDRLNMGYKSSLIVNGRGQGLVVATGMKTEIGRIAQMLQADEMDTPLKKRMSDFGRKLSYIILGICVMLFAIGLLRGEEPLHMLLISISLAVAAIPEALPALINIALAMGAKRLMLNKALIRKLPAVETLGSISYICSDKTGTLTVNRMKVVEIHDAGQPEVVAGVPLLQMAMALNHDVRRKQEGELLGDPTEVALVEHVEGSGLSVQSLAERYPRVAELPFDSDRKCMTTVHRCGDEYLVFSKGAFEAISGRLLNPSLVQKEEQLAEQWATGGVRVLAFGFKKLQKLPDMINYDQLESELIL